MPGYTGKILWVDLTQRTWREETIPEAVYATYLSGVGLGAYLLYYRLPPGTDPLGPGAILGFVAGVLSGTGALFAGRWMVVGKSPLTGGWGDANCGGNFAPAIKHCGYDGIFITGQADRPVYLYADGQRVEIREADDLWGKDALETEAALLARNGEKARVACIGPAGEKRSLIAGVVNDHGRLAARSGLGAVMGAKRLKAVVLAGSQPVVLAHPEEIRRLSKSLAALMPKGRLAMPGWALPVAGWFMMKSKQAFRVDGLTSLAPMNKWGTASGNEVCLINGDAPIRNWRGSPRLYRSKVVNADAMIRSQKKNYHCVACPLACGGICRLTQDGETGAESHRPEYETATAFGSLLLNQDLETIFALNDLVNRAGMDSISAGVTVAFALDCFEHGLLTEKDTGGLRLRWGDPAGITRLVEMMIAREGIGDLLADGVQRACERLGPVSQPYAFHAGGQELPMHDPRYDPAYGVFYISDPTPGRHTVGSDVEYEMSRLWRRVSWAPAIPSTYSKALWFEASPENGLKLAACSLFKGIIDGSGVCIIGMHTGVDRTGLFESLNAATGWEKTPDDYMEIGRRIQDLRQGFNLRHGLEPAAVGINPVAMGDPPAARGPHKDKRIDLPAMRREFWKAMRWDPETGRPPEPPSLI